MRQVVAAAEPSTRSEQCQGRATHLKFDAPILRKKGPDRQVVILRVAYPGSGAVLAAVGTVGGIAADPMSDDLQ